MATTEAQLATINDAAKVLEDVVIQGDLAKLTPAQRVMYYRQVCQSLGLNPFTKPFEYIVLNGKLTLYARRDATEQLRRLHKINLSITAREKIDDIYIVTARAVMPDGRTDESVGAVSLAGLKGDALANAIMKAETKAKRRVTLSIVGLGWLDESEVGSITSGETRPAAVDIESGEIMEAPGKEASGKKTTSKAGERHPTEKQLKRLFAIAREVNCSNEELKALMEHMFNRKFQSSKELTLQEYEELCNTLLGRVDDAVEGGVGGGGYVPEFDDADDDGTDVGMVVSVND